MESADADVEEMYVMVDFDFYEQSDFLSRAKEISFSGLDSSSPLVSVDGYEFDGQYELQLGTKALFDPSTGEARGLSAKCLKMRLGYIPHIPPSKDNDSEKSAKKGDILPSHDSEKSAKGDRKREVDAVGAEGEADEHAASTVPVPSKRGRGDAVSRGTSTAGDTHSRDLDDRKKRRGSSDNDACGDAENGGGAETADATHAEPSQPPTRRMTRNQKASVKS
jgi:hypothetical protein